MSAIITVLIVLTGASAAVVHPRDSSCCFGLTANGGPGGAVAQLYDGQNRIGQTDGVTTGKYCIDNGVITDGQGRGCILTPPTTQWQCDVGVTGNDSFAVGCDGTLTYQNKPDFQACPTEDNGGYNLYTVPPPNQQGCTGIKLTADGCKANCPAPPPPAPAPQPTCVADKLTGTAQQGNFEYPHLIVPVDSSSPSQSFGTVYQPEVCGTTSSLFNFDIPGVHEGKTCNIVFMLPTNNHQQTSSYELSGSGDIDFALLSGPVDEGTTSASAPSVTQDYGTKNVASGSSIVLASFPCPINTKVGVSMKPVGDTCLNYFQDYNQDPMGLYITVC